MPYFLHLLTIVFTVLYGIYLMPVPFSFGYRQVDVIANYKGAVDMFYVFIYLPKKHVWLLCSCLQFHNESERFCQDLVF